MANRPITDAELDELIALSDGPHVLHWGLLNRTLSELRESRWTPITPENPPRVGDDEVLRLRSAVQARVEQVCVSMEPSEWLAYGYTHRRPINAPSPKEAA